MTDRIHPPWTLETLRSRRNDILALAARHGATHVRVFGSVARGETDTDSDVDLLVTVRPGVSAFEMVGLWRELQVLLGCEVSLITDGINDRRFLEQIEPDLVAL